MTVAEAGGPLGWDTDYRKVQMRCESGDDLDFICNVCGQTNHRIKLAWVVDREFGSCRFCRSSLRMRSVVNTLSVEIFGRSLRLDDFPRSKDVRGIGLSDWTGYSQGLERKFSYTNTFYDREPRLDISNPSRSCQGIYDFIIATDVFEHIPHRSLQAAFEGCLSLLRPGGILVFTVPYITDGDTREHFPDLFEYRLAYEGNKHVIYNVTEDGRPQVFEDVVIHGGDGLTIEMRVFSEADVVNRLSGFESLKIYNKAFPQYGIIWPTPNSAPIAARKAG